MMKKKAFIVSGYFNPLHKGHLEYFNNAKALCDELFVIVNSDLQRELKGSKPFQEENERLFIVSNITNILTSAGTVSIFTILSIISMQFFLSFIYYDCSTKVILRKK